MSYGHFIQGQGSSKPSQDLNVNSLLADNIECVNLDVQNFIVNQQEVQQLFVKNIDAAFPETEITVGSDIVISANIDAVSVSSGTLELNALTLDNAATNFLVLDGDEVKYRTESTLVTFPEFQQVVNSSNYTTASLTYADSGPPVTFAAMETGKYMVQWSCRLSNTNAASTTTAQMVIMPTGEADVVLSEIMTSTPLTAEDFNSMSGVYIYDNILNVDTDFRIQFKVDGNTGLLRNYSVVVYKINV
jgi:hypothetical protein